MGLTDAELMKLTASGGGVGISLSRIRTRGIEITENGKSEGVVQPGTHHRGKARRFFSLMLALFVRGSLSLSPSLPLSLSPFLRCSHSAGGRVRLVNLSAVSLTWA